MLVKSTISDHLLVIEKIQKEDKWIPHELFELAIHNHLSICTSLLSCHKKSSFIKLYLAMKNRSTMN